MAENPGKHTIQDLVSRVHDGAYVIPHFQRGYEWRPRMVCDLFESILQNYYSGLLLFWELDSEEANKQMWDPVWGAQKSERPSIAILDGQQRLASLYYALYNPAKKFPNRQSYYQFFLNLDKAINKDYEEAVFYRYSSKHHPIEKLKEKKEQWIRDGVLPLSILSDRGYLDSNEFGEWLQTYVDKKRESETIPDSVSALYVSNILRKILGYEFVTNTLGKERSMRDVCSIFARINQMGMTLSTFDLMNAFLYPKGIELRKDWEALDNPKLKGVGSAMNEHLLRLISLHKQDYCSSKYIYNLIPGENIKKKDERGKIVTEVLVKDKDEFSNLWESSCKYAEEARKKIMNVGKADFGAIKHDFIPNTTILPVLGAISWEYKENQNDKGPTKAGFEEMLVKWYWSAVFSEDYSGSSDTMMAMDFRDWKKWLTTGSDIRRVSKLNRDTLSEEINLRGARKGSARYNAVLCLIALNNAKDFSTHRVLGTGDFSAENINDHHIFPSKVRGLNPEKSKNFEELKDTILNRTLLLDETNKHRISNKKPSQYLEEMAKESSADEIKGIMSGHFISEEALKCLQDDDFDSFIEEREREIKRHIEQRLLL